MKKSKQNSTEAFLVGLDDSDIDGEIDFSNPFSDDSLFLTKEELRQMDKFKAHSLSNAGKIVRG